jgi:hypothetical protein
MLHDKKRDFRDEDFVVRPALRVLGALILGFLACLFAINAQKMLYLAAVAPAQCKSGKGRLLCEVGSWINSIAPPPMQGPLAAMAHITMALIFAWATWLLLRPLVTKSRRKQATHE